MFSFLLKKMIKNRWMTLSLLLGNILLAGIVSAIPLYAQATMQKLLMKETETFILEESEYPGLYEFNYTRLVPPGGDPLPYRDAMRQMVFDELPKRFGIPSLVAVEKVFTGAIRMSGEESVLFELTSMSGFDEHSQIVLGRMYQESPSDGVVEGVVSRRTYDEMNIVLGTIYELESYTISGVAPKFRVVGVFDAVSERDPYWYPMVSDYKRTLVIPMEALTGTLLPGFEQSYNLSSVWQQNLDCGSMSIRQVERYLEAAAHYRESERTGVAPYKATERFSVLLDGYNAQVVQLNVTLWVLQAPMFIMLALFIYMVSGQILSIDRVDIAVLKSRGASRGHVFLLYFLQGLIICAVSAGLGLALGFLICTVTGASSGFLNLVSRSSLPIRLSPEVFLYVGAACLVSMLTMLVPVIAYSKVTIVDMKRDRGEGKKSLWQRFYLDIAALAVSGYSLWSFRQRLDSLASAESGTRSIDPLIFLTSSLFVVGLSLLCLRVFPWIVRGLFRLFRGTFSPALYASFLRVIRSSGGERFIMLFLIFTLATGTFNAKVARTINRNIEDRMRHEVGADLRIQEIWAGNGTVDEEGNEGASTFYYEPDFGVYRSFPEVENAARVLWDESTIVMPDGSRSENSVIMGVFTDEFGPVAWYRDGLLPTHLYNYLNAISQTPNAMLLSSNLKGRFQLGDAVSISAEGRYVMGVVYSFVDYWPGFSNYTKTENIDGTVTQQENYLAVANLGYLQSEWGVTPYEVWLKTNAGSGNFMAEYAVGRSIRYKTFLDAKADIITARNAPVLQGTNGILTVDFIITLVICAVGFLIYWVLSIKGRELQFGVFRAMGLSMKGILSILISEQVLISGFAIFLGAVIGECSSELFVPIIQVAYSASEQVIPMLIVMERSDYVRLYSVAGSMTAACLLALGVIVRRIKIAQALKLGED